MEATLLAVIVAEGFAILLLGLLVAGLLRSHAEILRALHELGASVDPNGDASGSAGGRSPELVQISAPGGTGGAAYDITGASLDDEVVALAIVGAPQSTLLAFLSSGCATCGTFWTAFASRNLAVPGNARLVVVVQDAAEESVARLRELAPSDGTLVLSSQAWADYRVPASPYFVYVAGGSGRIAGEGTAATWPAVADLLQQALRDAGLASGGRSGRRRERVGVLDLDRADRIDRELLAAGIGPGHPSLTPAPAAEPSAERQD